MPTLSAPAVHLRAAPVVHGPRCQSTRPHPRPSPQAVRDTHTGRDRSRALWSWVSDGSARPRQRRGRRSDLPHHFILGCAASPRAARRCVFILGCAASPRAARRCVFILGCAASPRAARRCVFILGCAANPTAARRCVFILGCAASAATTTTREPPVTATWVATVAAPADAGSAHARTAKPAAIPVRNMIVFPSRLSLGAPIPAPHFALPAVPRGACVVSFGSPSS